MSVLRRRRVTALVGALALVAGLVGVGGSAAMADPVIDPNTSGFIILHKHETDPAGGEPGDGSQQTVTTPAVEGVGFTLYRVSEGDDPIDLRTDAGWQSAAALAAVYAGQGPDELPSGWTTTVQFTERFTDEGGQIIWDESQGLPLGLYMVVETSPAPGSVPSAPFLVTVPITQGGDTWNYEVHVYPKNGVTQPPVKTVTDDGVVQAGDQSDWQIETSPVGTPYDANGDGDFDDAGESNWIGGYAIRDDLADALKYVPDTLAVKIAGEDAAEGDYTVTWDPEPGDEEEVAAGAVFRIDFTADGLAKLRAAAAAEESVVVTFSTTAVLSGEISNTAEVYPNGFDVDQTPASQNRVTSDPETQKFGGINLLKVDNRDEDHVLAGAVFQVYVDADNDGAIDEDSDPVAVTLGGQSKDSWETDEDGELVIDGLRYSNWANGALLDDDDDPAWIHYLLVETQAPEGYSLLAKPIPFDVTGQAATVTALTVENVPVNAGFALPLTGGAGVIVFTALAVLLLGGGTLMLMTVTARRRQASAAQTDRGLLLGS
ncbi:SpaH/EbpB family LPXTG-anchored major pilin [Leucobacter massiliensis]|nr:SpaH/EbpB family LPXTG-anchored major pilin [Leucobacter massiliensis]